MRGSMKDLPVSREVSEAMWWQAEWGDITIEFGQYTETVDLAPLLRGLPDNRCQCPHWGYVIKGRLRARFGDHEEVYNAGDAYYIPPGHTAVAEAGVEYVMFSPTRELARTRQAIAHNMQAMARGA